MRSLVRIQYRPPPSTRRPTAVARMSAPLRVAIFGESYLPYLSGVTVSTETLARGLRAAGHEVLLVAPRPAGGAEPPGAGAPGPSPRIRVAAVVPGATSGAARLPHAVAAAQRRAARRTRLRAGDRPRPVALRVGPDGASDWRSARGAPLVFTHHTRFGDYRHYLGPLAGVAEGTLDAYLRDFWAGCAAIVAPGSNLADGDPRSPRTAPAAAGARHPDRRRRRRAARRSRRATCARRTAGRPTR